MIKVVGVRFKNTNKIYYFDPAEIEIENDDYVIVETVRGQEYAKVVIASKHVVKEELTAPLKPIIRKANKEDKERHLVNIGDAKNAFELCIDKIAKHNLPMNLMGCEYTFDRTKLLFYFTAENRVDFRELVRDLAAVFRTRIELRQVGVRDEAKSIGGYGICGREYCCKKWLDNFQCVSIKMVKDQGLSLNPSKISGACGRLFCCLKFEQQNYEGLLKIIPTVGSIVETPDGVGKVTHAQALLEEVRVLFDKDGSLDFRIYSASDVKVLKRGNEVDENKEKDASQDELKGLED